MKEAIKKLRIKIKSKAEKCRNKQLIIKKPKTVQQ
jgi:hypothetical protein